jgi:hypothetical protein
LLLALHLSVAPISTQQPIGRADEAQRFTYGQKILDAKIWLRKERSIGFHPFACLVDD